MGVENNVNIGGVNFKKDNVKSSEVIERNGEQLNSVFLNDGTHIVYPDQDSSKNPTVAQYDLVNMGGNNHDGDLHYYKTGNYSTDFERISGAEITGTDARDTYVLRGCDNTKVDFSQQDGKRDKVIQKDSKYKGEKYESKDNTFVLGEKKDKVTNIEFIVP